MKTVLITGCNGFIGKKLTLFLLRQGIKVIGLDIIETDDIHDGCFTFYKYDLNNYLYSQLKQYNVDTFYHLAWCGVSSVDKNNPDKQFVNIGLTYHTLELAKEIGVKKVVIPGSMSEFSKYSTPVTGYEPDAPADLYAATKVAVRKIAYQFCEKNNLDLNWLLITSVYGMDRKDSNLITYTIENLKKNIIVETTMLEQKWDYIHIDDLIQAMYLIGKKGGQNLIYPIGSGEVHPLAYYVKSIGEFLDKENLIKIGIVPYKNHFIDNSIPNISALKKLGFVASSFRENMETII